MLVCLQELLWLSNAETCFSLTVLHQPVTIYEVSGDSCLLTCHAA